MVDPLKSTCPAPSAEITQHSTRYDGENAESFSKINPNLPELLKAADYTQGQLSNGKTLGNRDGVTTDEELQNYLTRTQHQSATANQEQITFEDVNLLNNDDATQNKAFALQESAKCFSDTYHAYQSALDALKKSK